MIQKAALDPGGKPRRDIHERQKEVHAPDVTLAKIGKVIKKPRKKTKALATLHATEKLKKTGTKAAPY